MVIHSLAVPVSRINVHRLSPVRRLKSVSVAVASIVVKESCAESERIAKPRVVNASASLRSLETLICCACLRPLHQRVIHNAVIMRIANMDLEQINACATVEQLVTHTTVVVPRRRRNANRIHVESERNVARDSIKSIVFVHQASMEIPIFNASISMNVPAWPVDREPFVSIRPVVMIAVASPVTMEILTQCAQRCKWITVMILCAALVIPKRIVLSDTLVTEAVVRTCVIELNVVRVPLVTLASAFVHLAIQEIPRIW